jgi:hypothetical protein
MRKVCFVLAILTVLVLVTNAAAQGRGQGGRPVGVPSTLGMSGNNPANTGQSADHRATTSGKPEVAGKSADHQSQSSARSADPTDTHGFKTYGQYVAAQHVAENLDIPGGVDALKALMTGDGAVSLGKAIGQLRPELTQQSIEVEVKKAEAAGKKADAEAKKQKPTS